MLTPTGPSVSDYSARIREPECPGQMLRAEADLHSQKLTVAHGELASAPAPVFADKTALTVVMAANGYPATPETGGTIAGIDKAEATGAKVFHAGTRMEGDTLVSSGGRVLNVTALGDTVKEAQAAAYKAVDAIDFPTGFCRRDIGWREIAREG
jgi:phosphoribosylamine--glycine ligase